MNQPAAHHNPHTTRTTAAHRNETTHDETHHTQEGKIFVFIVPDQFKFSTTFKIMEITRITFYHKYK
jgi:hypothetical protein